MTGFDDAREAIYLAFATVWDVGPVSGYTFDNEDYTPPDASPWVRLSVRHQSSRQDTLGKTGNRKFERDGTVLIQVFGLAGKGTEETGDLAKQAADIFEGVTLAGTTVRFNAVDIRETGASGKWYGMLVDAPFTYEEIK